MKLIEWIGPSRKEVSAFPDPVKNDIGTALMWAQMGGKHASAKPWKGLKPGVMEIISNYHTDTYRAIYTVTIGEVIYVLHAFQKKSKSGIATPKKEKDMIEARFKEALQLAKNKR